MKGWKLVMENENNIQIDKTKVKRIIYKLILMEKDNLKTKKYNEAEMIKRIKKAIEEEVECY